MSDESDQSSPNGSDEQPRKIPARRGKYRVDHKPAISTFERDSAKADFEFWARMATWTIEEAVALSFERDPETVTWESLQAYADTPFVESFRRMRKLADRATQAEVLRNPCEPLEFIRWAHTQRIQFSDDLAQVVTAHIESASRLQTERKQTSASPNYKSMKSLLKLVGGLAVAIYKYDPAAKKSDVPATIQSDLDLVGVNLDVDTIRKYLRLGVESAEIPAV